MGGTNYSRTLTSLKRPPPLPPSDHAVNGATSMDQQLGGAWAGNTTGGHSTRFCCATNGNLDPDREGMFKDCPGSIEGQSKRADGTPVARLGARIF